jgi:hypothetical protein
LLLTHNPPSADGSDPIEKVTHAMALEVCHDAHKALYALLEGTKVCGTAARNARLAQDNELAEFLCRVQEEVVEEAKRLLAQRVAE